MLQNILNLLKDGKFVRQNGNRTLLLTNEISVQTVTLNCLNIIKLINKLLNTIVVKRIRTKRLELLRNYFHSCLRRDCLPISTCSLITFATLLYFLCFCFLIFILVLIYFYKIIIIYFFFLFFFCFFIYKEFIKTKL